MSRTTTALKRLGVPGLAAVTLVAGLPLFLGTASAAHINGLSLTKANDQDAAGACLPYTVQLNFASAAQAQAETVDVTLTDNGTAANNTAQDVDFCTLPFGNITPATPTDVQDGGAAGTDHAEFRTDATGKVTFGIVSNQAGGSVLIRAFYETTDNDTFDAGEFTDVETQVFTDGGPQGTNANQDAARDVEVLEPGTAATASVTVNSDTDTAIEGEARTYRVVVLNSTGDRLQGVTVTYTLDVAPGGNSAGDVGPTTFGVTDNEGIATGTVTFPVRTGTADTTDTLTFFVNQSGGNTAGRDAVVAPGGGDTAGGEPQDTVVVTVRDATNQQNRTVNLVALPDAQAGSNATYTQSGDQAVNPATDGNRTFRAVVDAADGQPSTANTQLAFGVTGGSGDETVSPVECTTADFTSGAGDTTTDTNNSFCDVVVNDPTPTVGQTLTITATVRGTSAADTATLTFRNQPGDARFVALTPETVTVAPNTAQQLQARVTDVDGNPVQGVTVTFTENGAGAFRNGSSETTGTTNAQGIATVEVISLPGETGTQTVTATISAATTQCENAANVGTDPQGNNLNSTNNTGAAGVCSDSSTVTFGAASPSPSPSPSESATQNPTPSPTGTQSPSPVDCSTTPTVTLERSTIIATGSAGVRVNAPANSIIDLLAYSRPSSTYRVVRSAEIGANGIADFRVVPPTNTRLYAQIRGCDTDEVRHSVVLNVRTALSLAVERLGERTYRFHGDSLPARPGGLIVSLYRITDSGRQVLTAQTRADAQNGEWSLVRKFTGTGRFGFVVRTGQDLQNAPGSSNVRSLLVF